MTPEPIRALLNSPVTAFVGRFLLVFMFLGSAVAKLADFEAAKAEMLVFGLNPPAFFALATAFTQAIGGLLILFNRFVWLGAGALGIFTLATIPIAHHFWALDGDRGQMEFYFAVEHLAVIGGLILAAILAERPRQPA